MSYDKDKLIDAWIKLYEVVEREGDKSKKADDLFWAFEQFDELCFSNPDEAFSLVLIILDRTDNEYVLDNLAAGPLETLISRHSDKIISAVESEVNSNPKFKELLQGVWQNTMSDELWNRVKKIAFRR